MPDLERRELAGQSSPWSRIGLGKLILAQEEIFSIIGRLPTLVIASPIWRVMPLPVPVNN